ncbi:hypothetical protein BDW69DRAFT_170805 [Aspergillus filifer]
MWSPLAKSDQRSNAGSERKLSGSSAVPSQQDQPTDFNPKEAASGAQEDVQEGAENVKGQAGQAQDQAPDVSEQKDQVQEEEDPATPAPQQKETPDTEQRDDDGVSQAADSQAGGSGGGLFGTLKSLGGGLGSGVASTVKSVPSLASKPLGVLKGLSVKDNGEIPGPDGNVVGRVVEGGEDAVGGTVEEGGKIVNQAGETIGQAELTDEVKNTVDEVKNQPSDILKGLSVADGGEIKGPDGNVVGRVVEGGEDAVGGKIEEGGKIVNDAGETVGQAELTDELKDTVDETKGQSLDTLKGLTVGEGGEIKGSDGKLVGRVTEGGEDAVGGKIEEGGRIVNDDKETIGQADLISELKEDVEDPEKTGEGATEDVEKKSKEATDDAQKDLDDPEKKAEDATDDLEKKGEDATDDVEQRADETAEDAEKATEDFEDNLPPISLLEGLTCNKAGKIVDRDSGKPVGELVEGDPKKLSRLGCKLDDKGQFWDSRGNVIGKAKTIPAEDYGEEPPFAGLEGLHIVKDGFVEDAAGHRVGKLTEGDEKKLIGRPVDEDGDVIDQHGSVKGHAEPYEEPEEEQPEEEDLSSLEGKTVNKAGNVVDEHGKVFGRIVSGDGKRLAGRKVDGKGQIWGDDGKVIGRAELIPGDEQEKPEGEFYGFENLTVGKDGVVQDPSGKIVGRVIEGDATRLAGRKVDEDGEILDKSGNVIGKAERWEPEEKKRDINPMSGRKVNREGEVRDVDGNLIGKLTEGNLSSLIGKEIDDNGYVVDNDGNKIGQCTLLEHLPEPEPEEEPEPEGPSPEEQEAERKAAEDRDLAKKMSAIVGQTLDKVGPICKQITDHVDRAEKTPKDELDEEQLVKNVKPLLEEANGILQECNGAIRALDPDGHVAANAKARAASHEASPEEHALAEKLKELSDSVLRTIENGKRKIDGMPHAKKALNPLWGLLSEPLFQIIAAVGLLLTGVLGLVGRLLDGLGLGPLVNGLLGGLGLDKLLGNLGLTSLTDSLGLTNNKK